MKISILFFIISAFIISCGTDTGNPGEIPINHSAGTGIEESKTIVNSIVQEGCKVLRRCHNLRLKSCQDDWMKLTNMNGALGLDENSKQSLQQIHENILKEDLKINPENTCISAIKDLSCYDQGVEEAFDPEEENLFVNANEMIPTACQNVFDIEQN